MSNTFRCPCCGRMTAQASMGDREELETLLTERDALRAEVERLRESVHMACGSCGTPTNPDIRVCPKCRDGWIVGNGAEFLDRATETLRAEVERLRASLSKINDIRNDIVGRQSVHFSQHIYPLVAALEEAGIHGAGYEKARAAVLQFSKLLRAAQSLHRAWKWERDLADRYQRDHDEWMWNTDTCDCAICNDVRMTK